VDGEDVVDGDMVRAAVAFRRLTVAKLARQMGVAQSSLAFFLDGERYAPTPRRGERKVSGEAVAAALGVPVECVRPGGPIGPLFGRECPCEADRGPSRRG
jgi:hypothetical protein